MKQTLLFLALLTVLNAPAQISNTFFGNHIGGPLEVDLAGQGVHTLWPTTNPNSIRIWDTWGYNPNKGTYDYLFWRNINTAENTYDWGLFDRIIDSFKAHNITELVYTIGKTPAWAAGGNTSGSVAPTDTAYLSKFVKAVAQRAIARGWPIRNWEIWNEPNGSVFWSGTTAQMVNMAKAVYQAVKSVDPSYKVLSPCPQGSGADYWMNQFLAAGGGQWCDVISFHGYINFYNGGSQEMFEQLISKMQNLQATYNISNKELWDTEGFDLFVCGGTCYDYAAQAAYLAQRFLISAAKGVKRVFWYAWDQNHGKQWGNETGTFQVNEVGTANQRIVSWLLGATVSNLQISTTGVYSVDITKGGVTSRAVWVNSGTASYPTTYTQYETLSGTTGAVSGSVTVGRKPILLKTVTTTTAVAATAPQVSLTAPLSGATFTSPATITLTASASDADGTISKVEFYNGSTLVGTATTAPYQVSWSNVAAGTYSLSAKATDNTGLTTTSQTVSVSVKTVFYRDADGDSYGNDNDQVLATSAPSGYVSRGGDCNDSSSTTYPGAVEICNNGIDDNCDGQIDEGCTVAVQTNAVSLSTVVINDTTASSSGGTALFTLRLDKASDKPVAISYKTSDGSAKSYMHYLPVQGVLTIPAGSVAGTIKVSLLTTSSTAKLSSSKYFYMQLLKPDTAIFGDSLGKATISYKKQASLTFTGSIKPAGRPGLAEDEDVNSDFIVEAFPNPSNSYFKLRVLSDGSQPVTMNIIDISGRLIEKRTGISPYSVMQFGENLKKGVYLLQLDQGEKKTTLKVTKF